MEKDEKEENIIKNREFVRLMSEKTGFTMADVQWFLWAFKEVLADLIKSKKELYLRGIFRLKYHTIKEHETTHPVTGERIIVPPTQAFNFLAAMSLKDLLRTDDRKQIDTDLVERKQNLEKLLNGAAYINEEND